MRRDYEKGILEAERAVELEPNGADAHAFLGMGLRFADRAEEALKSMRKLHIGLRKQFSRIPKMPFLVLYSVAFTVWQAEWMKLVPRPKRL